jgi:dihydrofolate reductase
MAKLIARNIGISLDGYIAGPDQGPDTPLGVGGTRLHEWVFGTRTMRRMDGQDGGTEGLDDELVAHAEDGIGATIMGRNMFGPVRGGWGDDTWRGWWGEDPPYHYDVFVLTHHAHDPIPMEGGTTFHFVTDGIESALEKAFAAAGGRNVRLGGGAATIRQYLKAGLVDEMHLAYAPVLLGRGERLFEDLDGGPVGMECVSLVSTDAAAHAHFVRRT